YLRHCDVLTAVDERQVVLVEGVQAQLDADEGQDESQTVGQVDQAVEQSVEQEVHLSQAQQREGVGGEDDVRLGGNTVDRRDRIEGEHQVDHADGDDRHEQRGQTEFATDTVGQLVTVVPGGDRNDLAQQLDDEHVVRVGIRGLPDLVPQQLRRGVDQPDRSEERRVGKACRYR